MVEESKDEDEMEILLVQRRATVRKTLQCQSLAEQVDEDEDEDEDGAGVEEEVGEDEEKRVQIGH